MLAVTVMFADPLKLTPLMVRAVVNVSAVPAVATFKFATRVVLVITMGAVPTASVLVSCPDIPIVVTLESAPVTFAEPLKLWPQSVLEVVRVAAEPVVFWFSVGTSAATIARNVGVPAVPLGAAKNVLAVWEEKSDGVTDRVPPSVKSPELVTVPLSVIPLTVPVPLTLVTVPSGLFDH